MNSQRKSSFPFDRIAPKLPSSLLDLVSRINAEGCVADGRKGW